eukprot:1404365-Pyramimonas_sp.AAC.1
MDSWRYPSRRPCECGEQKNDGSNNVLQFRLQTGMATDGRTRDLVLGPIQEDVTRRTCKHEIVHVCAATGRADNPTSTKPLGVGGVTI